MRENILRVLPIADAREDFRGEESQSTRRVLQVMRAVRSTRVRSMASREKNHFEAGFVIPLASRARSL